jgi:hypothetical protein
VLALATVVTSSVTGGLYLRSLGVDLGAASVGDALAVVAGVVSVAALYVPWAPASAQLSGTRPQLSLVPSCGSWRSRGCSPSSSAGPGYGTGCSPEPPSAFVSYPIRCRTHRQRGPPPAQLTTSGSQFLLWDRGCVEVPTTNEISRRQRLELRCSGQTPRSSRGSKRSVSPTPRDGARLVACAGLPGLLAACSGPSDGACADELVRRPWIRVVAA